MNAARMTTRADAVRGPAPMFLALLLAACTLSRDPDGPRRAPLVAERDPMARAVAGLAANGARPRDDDGAAVILVAIDGARWQEIFEGVDREFARRHGMSEAPSARALMPHLHALGEDHGAELGAPGRGAAITASGPSFVSLPGYTELFAGRPSNGCEDNDCAGTTKPTLVDELRAAANDDAEIAVFSSWEKVERAAAADTDRVAMSTGRHFTSGSDSLREDARVAALLDAAADVRPWPGHDDYRPDALTAEIALAYLDAARPRFMFLGLGDTDEQAHRGDYAGYVGALRAADAVLGAIEESLSRMGPRGASTTVVVTADHGRARDYRHHGARFPESSRVWLVAGGRGVRARGRIASPEPRHLADVAPTLRVLLDLPTDESPDAGHVLRELFAAD